MTQLRDTACSIVASRSWRNRSRLMRWRSRCGRCSTLQAGGPPPAANELRIGVIERDLTDHLVSVEQHARDVTAHLHVAKEIDGARRARDRLAERRELLPRDDAGLNVAAGEPLQRLEPDMPRRVSQAREHPLLRLGNAAVVICPNA